MKSVFLGVLLFLTPAYAYKFLCNGITAEGITESDSCAESCISEPSHWPGSLVIYNVDISVLPTNVSASDWLNVVNSCFQTWAATPATNLQVSNGGHGVRSFGTDPNNHDIFWVTSEQEWSSQVGAAPNGILGVTLPPYVCPTKTAAYRQIDDADMILNAVPSAGFIWEAGCPKLSEACQSVRATVAHESGHFLGLGHPCAACQELMSAQAEFLVEYPLFDDQQGLAALYPDASKAGSFGSVCSGSMPCKTGQTPSLSCHTQGASQYCSSACATSDDCSNHMICNGGFCEFPGGAALGAVGLQGDCTQNPSSCDTGLICVAVSNTASYCYADCTTSQSCSDPEICHQLHNSQHMPIASYACMVIGQQSTSGITSGSGSQAQGCSSTRAPSEIWLLLLLMGILVHRPKKKC